MNLSPGRRAGTRWCRMCDADRVEQDGFNNLRAALINVVVLIMDQNTSLWCERENSTKKWKHFLFDLFQLTSKENKKRLGLKSNYYNNFFIISSVSPQQASDVFHIQSNSLLWLQTQFNASWSEVIDSRQTLTGEKSCERNVEHTGSAGFPVLWGLEHQGRGLKKYMFSMASFFKKKTKNFSKSERRSQEIGWLTSIFGGSLKYSCVLFCQNRPCEKKSLFARQRRRRRGEQFVLFAVVSLRLFWLIYNSEIQNNILPQIYPNNLKWNECHGRLVGRKSTDSGLGERAATHRDVARGCLML